jgi:hypothetical protein
MAQVVKTHPDFILQQDHIFAGSGSNHVCSPSNNDSLLTLLTVNLELIEPGHSTSATWKLQSAAILRSKPVKSTISSASAFQMINHNLFLTKMWQLEIEVGVILWYLKKFKSNWLQPVQFEYKICFQEISCTK